MTVSGAPKAPSGLGRAGRRLWREVHSDLEARGMGLRPDELAVLEAAARQADTTERLEAALKDAPLMVRGSAGQEVANPLLAEARQGRTVLGQLLARLKLDTDAAAPESPRTRQARRAANARWKVGGGALRPVEEA